MSNEDSPDAHASGRDLLRERYERKVGHLADIDPVRMQSRAVLEALVELAPAQALYWIDQLVRGSVWGRTDDMAVVSGFVYWIAQYPRGGEHYDFFRRIYRIAHEHEVDNILFFLQNPPPHQKLSEEAELPEVHLPMDRDDITVGERRTIARKGDKDLIDRLLFDPSPLVIRNLLDNPDLSESGVLKIASRRPTTPEILAEIVGHHRWFGRLAVRRALVMNPYAPTGVSLKLLPTVGIKGLRRVRYGSGLHPVLGDFATRLVDMRETHTSPWEV